MVFKLNAAKAAENALSSVLEAKKSDSLTILCDDTREKVGEAFEKGALGLGLNTQLVVMETKKAIRTQLPAAVENLIVSEHADIYVNLFRGNTEETPFRLKIIDLETHDHKTRLGHCPGVTLDMLTKGALALTVDEHAKMQKFAEDLMRQLEGAVKLELTTHAGTDLTLRVEARPFYTDTIMDWVRMSWMNLPTGEVIVAPVEDSLNGKLVCDMAIGGIGLIEKPVTIHARNGKVENVNTENAGVLKKIKAALNTDTWANSVGEFAFGINPKARVVEEFLETEKILGTCHIAFGQNTDMPGGKNQSANHMDFLMNKPTVKATFTNGKTAIVLSEGIFQPLKS